MKTVTLSIGNIVTIKGEEYEVEAIQSTTYADRTQVSIHLAGDDEDYLIITVKETDE